MDLVNELQASAVQHDVQTVLRNAKRLASKLGVDDIDQWLRCEQEGYGDDDEIPDYRRVSCTLFYNTNGPVPIGMGLSGNGTCEFPNFPPIDQPVHQSLNDLVALIDEATERGRPIGFPLFDESIVRGLRARFHPRFARQITFLLRPNIAQVRAIQDAVKDRVLAWACALEQRGCAART